MPNTKAVGVAFSDPELVAGTTITGATISGGTISGTAVSNATLTGASVAGTGVFTSLSVNVAKPAAAGSTRADATAMTASFNWVTDANGTKGVIIPAPTAGRVIIVKNDDTANAILKVYAPGSAKINSVAGSTSFDMAAKTACLFVAYDTTDWFSVPLVAS
jgi:hypothetical protein